MNYDFYNVLPRSQSVSGIGGTDTSSISSVNTLHSRERFVLNGALKFWLRMHDD